MLLAEKTTESKGSFIRVNEERGKRDVQGQTGNGEATKVDQATLVSFLKKQVRRESESPNYPWKRQKAVQGRGIVFAFGKKRERVGVP